MWAIGPALRRGSVSNGTVTWVSSDPSIVSVAVDGTVTAVGAGTAEIYGYTWNGLCDYTEITCLAKPTTSYEWESYEDKCHRPDRLPQHRLGFL